MKIIAYCPPVWPLMFRLQVEGRFAPFFRNSRKALADKIRKQRKDGKAVKTAVIIKETEI